jgi:hypothetical protein
MALTRYKDIPTNLNFLDADDQIVRSILIDNPINYKKIKRLYGVMGLQAIYPIPKLSRTNINFGEKCPYLLHDLVTDRPNYIWAVDISYISMREGHF